MNPTIKMPTDNLYKFIAIFGLIICIVSFFIPDFYNSRIWRFRDSARESMDYFKEVTEGSIEIERFVSESEFKLKNELFGRLQEVGPSNNKEYENLVMEYEEAGKREAASRERLRNMMENLPSDMEKFNETAMAEVAKRASSNSEEAKITIPICFFSGIILMAAGFYMWYVKTQKYLDLILKSRSEKYTRKK